MADLRVVDAEKLDADLLNISNAIDAVTGHGYSLLFPEEFVSELQNYKDQLEIDLTNLADAIQAKTGTEGTMFFPDDFIYAIENMEVWEGGAY